MEKIFPKVENHRMNKFGVALQIMIDELNLKKNRLETEGKLKRKALNQSLNAKNAPRADKIDVYLKAFGVTWLDFAKVLMRVEENWESIQVQPAQKRRIVFSIEKKPLKGNPPRDGPSNKTARRKHA